MNWVYVHRWSMGGVPSDGLEVYVAEGPLQDHLHMPQSVRIKSSWPPMDVRLHGRIYMELLDVRQAVDRAVRARGWA